MQAGPAQDRRGKASAARTGSAPQGKAQQANSEDTVTISSLGTGEDTETDNESAPARQVRQLSLHVLLDDTTKRNCPGHQRTSMHVVLGQDRREGLAAYRVDQRLIRLPVPVSSQVQKFS